LKILQTAPTKFNIVFPQKANEKFSTNHTKKVSAPNFKMLHIMPDLPYQIDTIKIPQQIK